MDKVVNGLKEKQYYQLVKWKGENIELFKSLYGDSQVLATLKSIECRKLYNKYIKVEK